MTRYLIALLSIAGLGSSAWAAGPTPPEPAPSVAPAPPAPSLSAGMPISGVSGSVDAGGISYLSYDDAVKIALNENVDLLALREQEDSLKSQSKQALGPNEPVLSYAANDTPSFSLSDNAAQTVYSVNWTVGFPGKSLSQSASYRHQAAAVGMQAYLQEINLMTSLSNSYVTFAINDAFYRFLLDEQKSDKSLIKLIEKRFAASQASKVDLLNAEVATQQIAQAILQNRNDYEVQLTLFRQLIRRPSDKKLLPRVPAAIVIPPVKQEFDDLVPIMLRNNQSIGAAQQTLEGTQALVNNAALQALPDFQLSAGLNFWVPSGAPNGPQVTRDYSIGIGIAVPLFFAFNELPGIRTAQHNRGAAEYQLAAQQLQATSALQTAYTSLKATLKDLEASEKLVVPAAKASFDLTLLTYSLGKADYLMLFQSRKAWHDSMRDLLTKRQTAAQFYNTLITQMGCDIARTEGPYACK